MPLLRYPNSTTLPWWHWGNVSVPFTFCCGSYSSETLLGSIYMGYFGKIALIFFTGCSYSYKSLKSSFWYSSCLFSHSWPKIVHLWGGAENTEMLLEMGTISSFGILSPVVDFFPELIWKLMNYLKLSHTSTDIGGGLENTMRQTLKHALSAAGA